MQQRRNNNLQGLKWGVLVFMQQPSLDAALARVRLRASQFARERLSLMDAESRMLLD